MPPTRSVVVDCYTRPRKPEAILAVAMELKMESSSIPPVRVQIHAPSYDDFDGIDGNSPYGCFIQLIE